MSCDWRRRKGWKRIAEAAGVSAQALERLFLREKKRAKGKRFSRREREELAAKTRALMDYLRSLGLKDNELPIHSRTGLPRISSQAGYAAVWDKLVRERTRYWSNRVRQALRVTPRSFSDFCNQEAVAAGDKMLVNNQTTGYNVVQEEADFPLTDNEPLLMYSNYAGRDAHFGQLLAEMELRGLVKPEQIRIGKKASHTADYWDDPEVEVGQLRIRGRGLVKTTKSLEAVIIIKVKSGEQTARLIEFFYQRARSGVAGAIPGSWVVPDIRGSVGLAETLTALGFRLAVANVKRVGEQTLIMLRRKTKISGCVHYLVPINPDLYRWIATDLVPP